MYKVVRYFTDLQDNNHEYKAGDIFPRKGLTVSDERLEELSSKKNKQGVVLIEKVDEKPVEKTTETKKPAKKRATKKKETA